MAEEPVIAKGSNGTVFAYKNKAVISRKGFIGHISQGIKGNRTIFYRDIKSVEFKKPKLYSNGYIQFITSAELATPKNTFWTSEKFWKDPNTVIFRSFQKKMASDFTKLYEYVMDNIENYK